MANLIPDSYGLLKSLAIYACPSAAIGGSYIWIIFSNYINNKINIHQINIAIKDAREVRDDVCGNRLATEQHKKEVQAIVEGLEKLKMEMIKDSAVEVRARIKEIISD